MQRWEYHILRIQDEDDERTLTRMLNSEGEQGWELISVTDKGYNGRPQFYFKRPIPIDHWE